MCKLILNILLFVIIIEDAFIIREAFRIHFKYIIKYI
jgi:hypothetical protein